jgi:hypothetical protein
MPERRSFSLTLLIATTLIALSGIVWAGPTEISYQGRLTSADGSPVADSAYSVLFTLYSDSVAGSVLWAENATITTTGGMFHYLLGSTQPFGSNLFTDNDRVYLEIRVGSEVLGPRTLFASVARAAVAGDIKSVDSAGKPAVRSFADLHKFTIYDAGGNAKVTFQDKPGDDAVILPDSSINSEEILDEPGVATNTDVSLQTLMTGEMKDLVKLDVTIPNDGYIVLFGKCYVLLSGTTSANSAIVQIDENEGGGTQFPYYDIVGLSGYVNSGTNYFPIFVTRTYYKSKGTYTFRLEGRASNASPALAQTWDHVLTAQYFPTAYYGVSAVMSSPMGNPTAVPIVVDSTDSIRTPGTYYQMDLKYFEDKDKAAKDRR